MSRLQAEHITRLTCHCGNTAEVPSQVGFRETDSFGSDYGVIDWSFPEGWSYAACPKCRAPPDTSDHAPAR